MPNLQVLDRVKKNEYAYENLLHYITRPDKCQKGIYGMTNVYMNSLCQPEKVFHKQIQCLREYHGKENRYALHLILRFAPSETKYLDHIKALDIAYYLAEAAFSNCMCYFAVHDHSCYKGTNQVYLHIDMMIVPFDIFNGKSYSCGKAGWYKIGYDIATYMEKFIPASDISKCEVFYGRHEN